MRGTKAVLLSIALYCMLALHVCCILTYHVILQLALTAASPIYRGYLSDIDTRWQVISESVDDRTNEERGLCALKKNK